MTALTTSGAAAQNDACDKAATLVRAYDQAAVNSGGRASQGEGKADQRQAAAATLLSCGALGGTTAAATIVATRSLTDTAVLRELVSPFRTFRDTAVMRAVISVAADPSASVEARVFAIRSLWTIRTGKYWIRYVDMLPTSESTPSAIDGACGLGAHQSHEVPLWNDGVVPPSGFETQLLAVAKQLMNDTSQPMEVRVAALCANRP